MGQSKFTPWVDAGHSLKTWYPQTEIKDDEKKRKQKKAFMEAKNKKVVQQQRTKKGGVVESWRNPAIKRIDTKSEKEKESKEGGEPDLCTIEEHVSNIPLIR